MAGRPSNREERYEQIMHALVHCVARFGLDGTTLAQIATQAGLSRPLIRHHLGNRTEIETALQDFVLQDFDRQSDALIAALPDQNRTEALIAYLFSSDAKTAPDMVLAFAALTSRSSQNPTLQAACQATVLEFEARIHDVLHADHPTAPAQKVAQAAHGVTALYFNMTSLTPLGLPESWTSLAKTTAKTLLKTLKEAE